MELDEESFLDELMSLRRDGSAPWQAPPYPGGGGGGGGGGMIPFYTSIARPASGGGVDIDQLLHSSSGGAGGPKMEHHGGGGNVQAASVDTASFGNLLCGVDEPPPFWPWPDHQHFH